MFGIEIETKVKKIEGDGHWLCTTIKGLSGLGEIEVARIRPNMISKTSGPGYLKMIEKIVIDSLLRFDDKDEGDVEVIRVDVSTKKGEVVINKDHKKYLQYIVNTGGHATAIGFDDDWQPIGPTLRKDLASFMIERDGKLILTDAGVAALLLLPD